MRCFQYIKVIYKGGYEHYYYTNDISFYKNDPEVERVEFVHKEEVNLDD